MGIKADINKVLQQSARLFTEFIAQQSFSFWQQKDFRKLTNFNRITQTEQDRIFNELIVTGICLLDLHLTDLLSEAKDDAKIKVLEGLHKEFLKDYPRYLKELGTPKHLTTTWDVLIKIRLKEFREDYQLAKKEMDKWDEFKKDPTYKKPLTRINTCSITCLQHIRRGKLDEKDLLWKILRKWVTFLEANVGKITQQILTI